MKQELQWKEIESAALHDVVLYDPASGQIYAQVYCESGVPTAPWFAEVFNRDSSAIKCRCKFIDRSSAISWANAEAVWGAKFDLWGRPMNVKAIEDRLKR